MVPRDGAGKPFVGVRPAGGWFDAIGRRQVLGIAARGTGCRGCGEDGGRHGSRVSERAVHGYGGIAIGGDAMMSRWQGHRALFGVAGAGGERAARVGGPLAGGCSRLPGPPHRQHPRQPSPRDRRPRDQLRPPLTRPADRGSRWPAGELRGGACEGRTVRQGTVGSPEVHREDGWPWEPAEARRMAMSYRGLGRPHHHRSGAC